MKRKLGVVLSGDSFAKAALPLIDYFVIRGFEPKIIFIERRFTFRKLSLITKDHLEDIHFQHPFTISPLENVIDNDADLLECDAILLSLAGGDIHSFHKLFSRFFKTHGHHTKRPILFAGYCGLVYEKFLEGYTKRRFMDVFYVNSQHDYDLFKTYEQLYGESDDNLILSGLPLLDAVPSKNDRTISKKKERKGLVFAGQTNVPFKKAERMFIVRKLVEYAEKHPSEIVFLKPRCRKGQIAYHPELCHYEDLVKEYSKKYPIPSNFLVSYEPLIEIFGKVDLCVSLSSTAVLEAHQNGLSIALLYDFGLDEKLGNAYFLKSGALRLMNQIIEGSRPEVDPRWMEYHFLADGKNCERVYNAVMNKIEINETISELRPIKNFISPLNVAGIINFELWYLQNFASVVPLKKFLYEAGHALSKIIEFFERVIRSIKRQSLKAKIRWIFRKNL